MKTYNKLVRSKIIDIIKREGKTPTFKKIEADEPKRRDEIKSLFKAKVKEEALEVFNAESEEDILEEIADLQEVLEELTTFLSHSSDDIISLRRSKNIRKGYFNNWGELTYLETVED